jgi:hypothetical protein
MKKYYLYQSLVAVVLLICSIGAFAQESSSDDESESMEKKGMHFGFFIGPYWANAYTASLYNGYGLDVNGAQNEFANSLMYNKIMFEYGGGNGQVDQIAQALGVDPQAAGSNTWHFGENDMPQDMRYSIAFLVGLNGRYSTDKKNAIILNVNASKLKITGHFTIETDVPLNQNQLSGGQYINTFDITGSEQRMMFQFGYSRIMGDNKRFNFFMEGGLNATLAKFDKNNIKIKNLTIDLTTAYIIPNSGAPTTTTYFPKKIGIGFGAFASAGFNITMSPKWTVQLLYSPTYDKINIGINPVYKLQHAAGVRAYYNF